ncbi:MAG: hypothetical protein KatS3mg108_0995 [Isosphaeraceae bacterium]|nr:MAG: hypothetical protein KatS3mg108_0995 [Isosphaeraceae bacterium]
MTKLLHRPKPDKRRALTNRCRSLRHAWDDPGELLREERIASRLAIRLTPSGRQLATDFSLAFDFWC